MNAENEKWIAAIASADYVKNGMIVGLGSGSTAAFMIAELGKRIAGGLIMKGVPSSDATARLAKQAGISLLSLDEAGTMDINIDGADEFDSKFQLIKGGGGALLREKILAHNSRFNIIIADSGKQVERLGKFKLPVETIPFATETIISELSTMDLNPRLRMKNNEVYKTDENNCILDIDIFQKDDLKALNDVLIQIPGVVETGLFLSSTDIVLMGQGNKVVTLKK
ncbi:ribose-5-phosphate isomerase RpiA [Zobellia sp. 1_MG-2023]|uniref:ribose-5-phosphate isomerase RpiA n=1 Tax=Zobellia sp. 1_MG-2023 TaxID=3062626 RepID=UPI0026E2B0B1|nr:ribose-5-phosphate isomerase RpiA [Zobellia sp. 1_MG-2023]MDO6820570.1 ribose-5-phosphate isomerase RpiA [Zobellia sp. 1_MG-2023]